jgi:uncharacterized membrane protein
MPKLMDKEQKIKEIQQRIDELADGMQAFAEELQFLQDQLDELQRGGRAIRREMFRSQESNAWYQNDVNLEHYIGLRFMHIVGIVVLVIGLSIGVKYAIDRQLISEVMRVGLAYAAGIALFVLSVRLKKKYQVFSAILFSGAMASLYFTTYAAVVYYHFIPTIAGFIVMTALTVFTVVSAMSYDRQEIAVLGIIGAYGIPFLISANADRADLFLSYILLINIGVLFISFRRSWRTMQYLSLIITWILFCGWAFMQYEDRQQSLGTLFMVAYYILFLISAIASRISRTRSLLPGEVQQIVLNNIAFYLASILVFGNGGFEINIANTTGFIALLMAVLALLCYVLFPGELLLQRLLAWQAILLLIFFIGLKWDGLTVTLLWIVIAVLLFVWGVYSTRSWPRLASIIVMGFTLGKLILIDSATFSTIQKIIAFVIIGVLLLVFSFYYQKFNLSTAKKQQPEV